METRFASLDRQTRATGEYREPASCDDIAGLTGDGPMIARGAGVSYVGASFGERTRSIGMRRLDRIISVEPERKCVTVQAGASLGALYNALLPQRLYLPVQPGHPQISVGACVACNVHGKNPQRDGVFADLVESLRLFHPDRGVMDVSRERHADVFELTCGGFGLTGIILDVTLRLADLPASAVVVRKVPVRNLEDTFEQFDELKSRCDFLYSWNDLSVFDARLGRGYIMCARFASDGWGGGEPVPPYQPLDPVGEGQRRRPRVFSPWLIPWITGLHYRMQMHRPIEERSFCDVMFPGIREQYVVNRYYYSLYGPTGFFGHMVLLPKDRWRAYVAKLEQILRRHRAPLLVTSIKAFAGTQRLLHFNGSGFSMHFHIANNAAGQQLVGDLERLSHELQTIRTIYFDSRMSASDAQALYPDYDAFKERLHRFDPKRLFVSTLSQRLDL